MEFNPIIILSVLAMAGWGYMIFDVALSNVKPISIKSVLIFLLLLSPVVGVIVYLLFRPRFTRMKREFNPVFHSH